MTYEDALREAMAATVPPRQRAEWNTYSISKPRINHAKVLAMKAQGYTRRQIADAVFCEPKTVTAIIRDHRLRGGKVGE